MNDNKCFAKTSQNACDVQRGTEIFEKQNYMSQRSAHLDYYQFFILHFLKHEKAVKGKITLLKTNEMASLRKPLSSKSRGPRIKFFFKFFTNCKDKF